MSSAPLFSLEAEQAVLGGLFVSPIRFPDVAELVKAADFADPRHQVLFATLGELTRTGRVIDLVVVLDALEGQGRLEQAGGMAYVVTLARDTPSAANVRAYAAVVRNHARRRALLTLSEQLGQWTLAERDVEAVLSRLQQAITAMDAAAALAGPLVLADLLPEVLNQLEERSQRQPGTRLGVPMGLADVDDRLDGFCPGRLYVVAGRPGHGKSVFGLQAARAAVQWGRDALLFTLEMPHAEVMHRLLSAEQPLDYGRLQAARMDAAEWQGLTATAERLARAQLWIDDSSSLTIADLLTRARRLHRRQPLGLVVVDYLSLVTGEQSERRDLEVGSVTRALKQLAKELSAPVLLLAQLNRKLEERADKRPIMSDLRESGAVEQDADAVLFLYRDDLYHPDSADKGCAELIIGKNRAGKTGTIPLMFRGEHCTFLPLAGPLPSRDPATAPAPRKRGIEF